MTPRSFLPQPLALLPWKTLFVVTAIAGFGFLVLYSTAGGSMMPWALPHAIRFATFLTMAIAISLVPPHLFRSIAFPLYAVIVFLLLLVEALGFVGGGAQSWLDLGFIRLQPSELMKVAVVLAIAAFYDMLPAAEIRRWTAIWPAALLIGVPWAFVLMQPDLGTATMILASGLTVMFLAGLPLRLFVGGAALLAVAVPIAYSFLHDYQQRRVDVLFNPEADPLGAGYHISQSKIAIGSGGITGKGFLNGTQTHLNYLPETHTDFIFSAMAEEWGLIGGLLLIFAFGLVIRWGMKVAFETKGRFERLTAGALASTIFYYAAINLLMVMGLAPVVGLPLPLFSHGGSAMLTVMLCLGILMSIDRDNRKNMRGRSSIAG